MNWQSARARRHLLSPVASTDFSGMRLARLAAVGGALGLAWLCLLLFAPGYWTELGFPLDDSWIHAVYGRELARSGMLAYNPGIPAAGETSPLWAVFFAVPHLIASDPWTIVLLTKVLGFALHGVTAFLAVRLAERAMSGPTPWSASGPVPATTATADSPSSATAGPLAVVTPAALQSATAGRSPLVIPGGLAPAMAGVLVALHPDLVAASVSGMEIPLATALALWVTLEVLRGPSWRLAVACFLAPLGRPEVACIGFFAVGLMLVARMTGDREPHTPDAAEHDLPERGALTEPVEGRLASGAAPWHWAPFFRLALVVAGSTFLSFGLVALRNWMVTGRPLPSTFYAKVGARGLSPWFVQWFGYRYLLEHLPLVNSLFLLVPVVLFACWLLLRSRRRATDMPSQAPDRRDARSEMALPEHAVSAGALSGVAPESTASADKIAGVMPLIGIAFFSVSFALVPPTGPTAFYFQRYALPGLPFVLIGLPLILEIALRAVPARRVALLRAAVVAALAVGLLAPMPGRLYRLANDARNIDDVQVAEGRALAQAARHHVVWGVDAGAIRYFGNAFIVDTIGLNTPEVLSAERASYFARHRPHYFSIVPGWSELDADSMRRMEVEVFKPTTRYTVTAFLPQAVHYLKRCPREPHKGQFAIFRQPASFQCGTW